MKPLHLLDPPLHNIPDTVWSTQSPQSGPRFFVEASVIKNIFLWKEGKRVFKKRSLVGPSLERRKHFLPMPPVGVSECLAHSVDL